MQSKKLHVLCWALMYFYIVIAYLLSLSDVISMMLGLSITLVQMLQFYFCYCLVYPLYLQKRKWWVLVLGFFMAMILFIALRLGLEETIYPLLFNISNYGTNISLGDYVVDNLYYGSAFICISAFVYSVEQNYSMHLRHAALQEERKQSELAFLRMQVNPHFLFNTLNFLYAQALPVSGKLSDSILKLSELMRYTLAEHPHEGVEIQKEIDYLENFIALHKMRFEKEMNVEFTLSLENSQKQIAPLILVPFVENSFKHGLIANTEIPIQILIREKDSILNLRVINGISSGPKDHSHGIGLDNVRRRLELLYPNKYSLEVLDSGQVFQVDLQIYL